MKTFLYRLTHIHLEKIAVKMEKKKPELQFDIYTHYSHITNYSEFEKNKIFFLYLQ